MVLTILTIEEFLFNPVKLGVLLLVFSLIGYILFVKCIPLSDGCWKKTEIILLLCSILGLGGIVENNRRFFYEREQKAIEYKIDVYKIHFNRELNSETYNRSFFTTIYSPKKIQEIEKDYKVLYLWILENKPMIIQHVCERRAINMDSIAFPQVLRKMC